MEIVFIRSWREIAVRGVVSLLFGVVAVVWPAITLTALVLLFGMYSLADGVLALLAATRRGERARAPLLVLEAVVGVGVGLAALLWPSMTTWALVALIGSWAILTGLLEVGIALRLRRVVPGELLLGLAGGLSIAFGILVLFSPQTSAFAIVVLLGGYALFFGTSMVALAFRLRKHAPSIAAHHLEVRTRAA